MLPAAMPLQMRSSACHAVGQAGGMYFSHIRGESDTVLEAAQEAITVGERAGVAVQISHLKTAGRGKLGENSRLARSAGPGECPRS